MHSSAQRLETGITQPFVIALTEALRLGEKGFYGKKTSAIILMPRLRAS